MEKRCLLPAAPYFPFREKRRKVTGKNRELETVIGYAFKNPELLSHALTHSSYANERHWAKIKCNERLEFLGDAVLEVVASEFLFRNYPAMPEGEMTKLRASLVCEPTLAYCAEAISLGKYLLLGKGEDMTGGRKRPSVTSDAMEAIIGAIYLDGGLANAKEFIFHFILNDIEHKRLFYDSKTILQELVQADFTEAVSYRLLTEEGPDHDKTFVSAVYIGKKEYGRGRGRTKKSAEQEAAYQTILLLRKNNVK